MASFTIHTYEQRPARVNGGRVTSENLGEAANWTGGKLIKHTREHSAHLVLANGTVVTEGMWLIRSFNGTFEALTEAQFIDRYQSAWAA